jgi:hypothetical protein
MVGYHELLDMYMGGGRNINARGFLFSVWLFFKGRAYRNRRERILLRQCKIRAHLRLKQAYNSASIFDKISRDDIWQGALMPIPFQQGADNE